MKRIYPDKEYCIGCGLCEIACLKAKSESGDIHTAYLEERRKGLVPRLRVRSNDLFSAALSCRHCSEPECISACISGALFQDIKSGLSVYDSQKCVSCYACVAACSYGAVFPSPTGSGVVKCNFCVERPEGPACVEACPNMALIFEEREAVCTT